MVVLPNPRFEPKTHRWRPGTGAPSLEVPSLKCAVLGQKQPFFAQNSPQTRQKRPNEGEQLLQTTCGLTSPCQRALWCPSTRRYVREMAQKGAKKPQNLRNVHQPPEPKQGPYLRLRGSKSNSEGTQSTGNPPLFVVSSKPSPTAAQKPKLPALPPPPPPRNPWISKSAPRESGSPSNGAAAHCQTRHCPVDRGRRGKIVQRDA